ncbi:MAG TPA: hypothetical protein H9666_02685 [Firmicutes bacterium]|nr:hypothetical protein [Bacillota bacterium]
MISRITSNAMMKNYKSNLMKSTNVLYNSMTQVMTQRKFNSYAEDPAAATQAFQLRRSAWRTESQIENSQTVTHKFNTAYEAVDSIYETVTTITKDETLRALNDPTGGGRKSLGILLDQRAEDLVQSLNAKYGDNFIFAGNDGENVPFSWDEATGQLLYRGVNVNAGSVPEPGQGATQAEIDAYEKDQADLAKLQQMMKETTYVDLGMGLQEDASGNIISTSAFNSALSGLSITGFGVDEEGLPNNVVSIVKELSDILGRCDEDGNWASTEDQERAVALQKKLDTSLGDITSQHTELSTKVSFLNTNEERLKSTADTLNTQIVGVENVDMADAITAMSYAQYCYNAALRVGTNILSQSLIDYMR